MTFEEPRVDTKCGVCSCIFGKHFVSFGGDVTGCTTNFDHREGRCTCKGFALIYRPNVRFRNDVTYHVPPSMNKVVQRRDDSVYDQPGGGRVEQQWER